MQGQLVATHPGYDLLFDGFAPSQLHRNPRKQLGPDFDVAKHLTPSYNPWDQRLCLVPDGDLFKALRSGKASIVTDTIERFIPNGVLMSSGEELQADVVVSATGLKLQLLGGMALSIDGHPVDLGGTLNYKGMMFSDVPNLAVSLGYTNASWTLKCELIARYVCRLLTHLEEKGHDWCVPRRRPGDVDEEPILDLASGYVQRAASYLPKQGVLKPWKLHQNYALDLMSLRHGRLEDSVMAFGRKSGADR